MKQKSVTIGLILMITIGIVIIGIVVGKPLLSAYNVSQATNGDVFSEVSAEQMAQNQTRDVSLDGEIIGDGSEYDPQLIENIDYVPSDAEINVDDMVGQIYIPAVDLHQPILDPMTNENLWVSAVTMKPNQKMGEGNYALAGHMMANKNLLFSPLENAEAGQVVYLTDRDTVYEYTIDTVEVVHETSGEVILDDVGDEMITLVTCEHPWNPNTRIVVQGQLNSEYNINDADDEIISVLTGET